MVAELNQPELIEPELPEETPPEPAQAPSGDYSVVVLAESMRASMMVLKSILGNSGAMLKSRHFEMTLLAPNMVCVRNRKTSRRVFFPTESIAWSVPHD